MIFKLRLFSKILILFGLTQLVGIFAARRFLPEFAVIRPGRVSDLSLYDLAVLAAFVFLFIFLVKRFRRFSSVFFKFFLTLVAFAGTQAILALWLPPAASVWVAILLLVLFWFLNNVFLQDLVMLLTFAGVGAIFGLSLAPEAAVLVLAALSFYDIIAVYKTKHMVELAETMIRSRAIFGFVVPGSFDGFKERMTNVSPGEQFMILGSGDLILPLLLSASLARTSVVQSAVVALFSVAGLFLMHLIFTNQKVRRPMAALPPIAMMEILGYLVIFLV